MSIDEINGRHVGKNYSTDEGNRMIIGGVLELKEDGQLEGFPKAENLASNATLPELILAMKNGGLMTPDSWNVSVLACPTPASMPTSETASNSGHATVSIEDTAINIILDCAVNELDDADHGATWNEHKWLGFGVRTGLDSVVGIKFTDDTGASVILTADDATEATALGLSAGDFVLYIKAEQPEYLTGEKYFTLWANGYAKTKFSMQIIEPTPSESSD